MKERISKEIEKLIEKVNHYKTSGMKDPFEELSFLTHIISAPLNENTNRVLVEDLEISKCNGVTL